MYSNEGPGEYIGGGGKANTEGDFQIVFHLGQFIAHSHGTGP